VKVKEKDSIGQPLPPDELADTPQPVDLRLSVLALHKIDHDFLAFARYALAVERVGSHVVNFCNHDLRDREIFSRASASFGANSTEAELERRKLNPATCEIQTDFLRLAARFRSECLMNGLPVNQPGSVA
jgi:hypothetical protein